MELQAFLTLGVMVAAAALWISERLPMDVVAMLVLASLLILGLVTPAQALSGFSSEATITVAAMFVLSSALARSGALRAMGDLLARIRQTWLFTLTVMLCLGAMSAFINNTAALAVFLPVVLAVAARNHFSASKILIPMSYAAQMGGVCTLIGTSTNLLVNSIALEHGLEGFGLFEFAPLGLITMAAGLLYVGLLGPWLLPDRRATELTEAYGLNKYIAELRVMPGSPLIGQTVTDAKLADRYGVFVLELLRGDTKIWSPRAQSLQIGDILLARGDWDQLSTLKDRAKLQLEPEFQLKDSRFRGQPLRLVEAMITPGSRLTGQNLAAVEFETRHTMTVLAIHRRGEVLREKLRDLSLNVGDLLLLLSPERELAALRNNQNLVVLNERENGKVSLRVAISALAVMTGVVAIASVGWLPIVAAAILGCIALVLLGVLKPEEVYDSIDWHVIMLLAGVLPLGVAMQNSGAAALIAQQTLDVFGHLGPLAMLAVIYLLTAILTEFMSNNGAAVLMSPLAIATAQALDSNPSAFLVAVIFAASTSFATPVGYQTNTMVYNAGGYRFTDFIRFGTPLVLVFWAVAVAFIPRFWPL